MARDIDEAIREAEEAREFAGYRANRKNPVPSRRQILREFTEASQTAARLRAAKARGETTVLGETE